MIKFNKIGKLIAGAVLAMSSSAALADHVPGLGFSETTFTINPSAVGLTGCGGGTCTAKFIDFSYGAEVDQTNSGPASANFTETGAGFFGTFRTELDSNPLFGTGLGSSYQMYFVFTASGTTAPGGGQTVDGTFDTFNYSIYIDRNGDTTLSSPATGAAGGNESVGVSGGGADDFEVLRGELEAGGFHIAAGLANGDFSVIASATRIGNFFGGEAFETGEARTDINGNNREVNGTSVLDPFGNLIDITIKGSGNASFEPVPVPEPASLALFGLALAGVAFSRRGKKA